jgi:tetratricopeptide (TPR) repeat protein
LVDVILVLATAAAILAVARRSVRPSDRPSVFHQTSAQVRDQDIRFYQARVARDPYGARDRAALGALYLARGRTTGDAGDFARAESLATTSLSMRHRRNGAAAQVLVSALMAEHRFAEAWAVMLPEAAADPADAVARATLGEIALELGRYHTADSLFSQHGLVRTHPAIAPRYARWLELNGRSGEARDLLTATRQELDHGFRVPDEQLAWFDLRIGELAFRNGRRDLAESAYDRGLAILPGDPRLLAARARLAAADGAWDAAIALGERTLERTLDPATLGLLSDAYAARGNQEKAEEYARAMEVSVARQPGAYHRGWALFLLDHHRQVGHVLAKAREELEVRKDIYGDDVMGWALHQAGRDREALSLADSALSLGTRDAMLHYHRGLIALALADTARARADLARALEINPAYRPEHGPAPHSVLTLLGPE